MDRTMLLLFAVAISGVLGLALFAQITAPKEEVVSEAKLQPTLSLGSGEVSRAPESVQVIEIKALSTGEYDKQVVRVKAGIPVKLKFSAEPAAGCGRQLVMPDFGISLVSRSGETVEAQFTPQKGQYTYRCGMNMFRGVLYAD
ncbi:MAG: cupredoxin domain-containing protein [Candidatus Micrarchaeota archaeon]